LHDKKARYNWEQRSLEQAKTMPIYEYQCSGCEAEFELLIRGKEKPVCPQCDSKKVSKQLSVISSPNMDGSADCAPQVLPGGG
jgi:putative FmdB family regulatory protein